jgi:hypothetical protein
MYIGIVSKIKICKISKANMLISLLKTFDILLHTHVVSVEILRLETTHFQKYMYIQEVFAML